MAAFISYLHVGIAYNLGGLGQKVISLSMHTGNNAEISPQKVPVRAIQELRRDRAKQDILQQLESGPHHKQHVDRTGLREHNTVCCLFLCNVPGADTAMYTVRKNKKETVLGFLDAADCERYSSLLLKNGFYLTRPASVEVDNLLMICEQLNVDAELVLPRTRLVPPTSHLLTGTASKVQQEVETRNLVTRLERLLPHSDK